MWIRGLSRDFVFWNDGRSIALIALQSTASARQIQIKLVALCLSCIVVGASCAGEQPYDMARAADHLETLAHRAWSKEPPLPVGATHGSIFFFKFGREVKRPWTERID